MDRNTVTPASDYSRPSLAQVLSSLQSAGAQPRVGSQHYQVNGNTYVRADKAESLKHAERMRKLGLRPVRIYLAPGVVGIKWERPNAAPYLDSGCGMVGRGQVPTEKEANTDGTEDEDF